MLSSLYNTHRVVAKSFLDGYTNQTAPFTEPPEYSPSKIPRTSHALPRDMSSLITKPPSTIEICMSFKLSRRSMFEMNPANSIACAGKKFCPKSSSRRLALMWEKKVVQEK
jgi:hypothetical protein